MNEHCVFADVVESVLFVVSVGFFKYSPPLTFAPLLSSCAVAQCLKFVTLCLEKNKLFKPQRLCIITEKSSKVHI